MDAFLQMSINERRLLCEQAEANLGLRAGSIEKDYWVCWTLRELTNLAEWGEHLTFKGGTSLSKAWKLIDRFSEDIDVVIERAYVGFGGEELSNNQRKRLVKTCSQHIHQQLKPALEERMRQSLPAGWALTVASKDEDPDEQTLFFEYSSAFGAQAGYVEGRVRIEIGARSDIEPAETPQIQPYLAEAFPEILGESSFSVRTIAARRTFWEKAMLLHEETFRPEDRLPRKPRMARHYYDLWSLINKGTADEAAADLNLFTQCAEHRQSFFRIRWVDYATLRQGTLRLVPPEDRLRDWRLDYQKMSEEMFFGEVPPFDKVISAVREFERTFNLAAK